MAFTRARFDSLPATAAEAREIAALWNAPGSEAQQLAGAGASEEAFKREAPGHSVLHLATHGFFLDERCEEPATIRSDDLDDRGGGGIPLGLEENPLLRSGLALAGANHRNEARPGADDGILTAEEVAALNLNGVSWAVLSACNTGVGSVVAGEGVFGLRRAFMEAGARTVVMSLWSVDDQSARAWMRALYTARFQHGLTTAESIRSASLAILEERRRRGQNTHPGTWGAFIAAGDWR
jgi:CHAT domain-containing protein